MKRNGLFLMGFGLIVFAFGLVGYLKANSLPSIISASIFAVILLVLGYQTLKKNTLSESLALFTTLFIDLFFSYRLFKTHALFPAGLLVLLSSSLALLIYLSRRPSKKRVN